MLVSQVISRAYILSGLVSRSLNTVNREQSSDGLDLLNLLMGEINIQPDYIPYFSLQTMTTVEGQEQYFFENVAEVMTLTYVLNNVRYAVTQDNRNHYFGSPRAENISSLPFRWYSERVVGGTQVYLYFFPSQSLVLNLKCKMFLPTLTVADLDTDLSTIYDLSYQSYLIYLLTKKICQWNKISVNPEVLEELKRFQQIMDDMNPKDLTVHKQYSLSKGESLTYADVNFGRGWTT